MSSLPGTLITNQTPPTGHSLRPYVLGPTKGHPVSPAGIIQVLIFRKRGGVRASLGTLPYRGRANILTSLFSSFSPFYFSPTTNIPTATTTPSACSPVLRLPVRPWHPRHQCPRGRRLPPSRPSRPIEFPNNQPPQQPIPTCTRLPPPRPTPRTSAYGRHANDVA